ncbi:glycosyltransferase [Synechococcus sp. CS-1332]|uniref:glycosyltransferase n=1 Tax=Synechococcus sp. CS-1332 TaxID=2847972 RepID=UPI00223BAB0A|nr:glycosyltransferase [Synechococcus sp. CS-1332]MCT0208486.1 glycosyltransferase [Synechococcus sp. CS-1332]
MRPIRFLLPGTTGRFRCGGLLVELQTARLTADLVPTEVVTYRQREPDHPFLDDLLAREPAPGGALWIVSWGFDVPGQLRRLRGRPVAYHAHSSGYGFSLPPGVPVLAVSRNTLGYWGDRAPRNPLFLVPNALHSKWLERGNRAAPVGCGRPIDVLVQQRKSSRYVLQHLVPALRRRGLRVEVQSGWVDDLVDLFNSAAVVLYDSADYWRGRGVSEGFGLPPLEALACGCVVFSSLNHALADSLDPGVVGHQIGCGSLEHDLERIQAAVADPMAWLPPPARLSNLLEACSEPVLQERWHTALEAIDAHWSHLLLEGTPPLRSPPRLALRIDQWWRRFWAMWRSLN